MRSGRRIKNGRLKKFDLAGSRVCGQQGEVSTKGLLRFLYFYIAANIACHVCNINACDDKIPCTVMMLCRRPFFHRIIIINISDSSEWFDNCRVDDDIREECALRRQMSVRLKNVHSTWPIRISGSKIAFFWTLFQRTISKAYERLGVFRRKVSTRVQTV